MKNYFFYFIIFLSMTLVSCAGSKAVVDNETAMRGDWTITNVTVTGENPAYLEAKVFDEADYKCYEGSSWKLVQNNHSGHYTLNGGSNCPSSAYNIKWFITEENGHLYFNFKRVYEGAKPKHVTDGYRMRLVNNTGSSFMLTQDLMFEGKPININYTFTK